jgi:hypothetical protein
MRFAFLWGIVFVLLATIGGAAQPKFETDNVLVKITLHGGESVDKFVSVRANEKTDFEAEIVGLSGVSLDVSRFGLGNGEQQNLKLTFDSRSIKPGFYIGSLDLRSGRSLTRIPLLLEVESTDTVFDASLDIPPEYKSITSSDKLVTQIKLFDLLSGGTQNGVGPKHVIMEYDIYTLEANQISSQTEDTIVDRQTQLTKAFSFPYDLPAGDYIIVVKARYQDSLGIASSLFTLSEPAPFFSPSSLGSGASYVMGGALLFFLMIIFVFVYFVRDRDKLLVELRHHQSSEVAQLRTFLTEQQRLLASRGVASVNTRKEVASQLVRFKKRQKVREQTLKALRKEGDEQTMKRKLAEWKREGYDTSLLDYRLKGLSVPDMKHILEKWKRRYSGEGYKNTR